MAFQFKRLEIPGVILVQAPRLGDSRGFFRETYKLSEFAAHGIADHFVQDNQSHSVRGVLRGMHYQLQPRVQGKLLSVLNGEIMDVAVDIRRGSPTYGRWVAEVLSADSGCMLYVPPGLAHGFLVLSAEADLLYKVTAEYAPELERGFAWNDPDVGIRWPIAEPILSRRDEQWPLLRDCEHAFSYEPE